jgi:hypothetical protein
VSSLLTAVGVYLIYLFTEKIVAYYRNQIKIKWSQFIIHIATMTMLIVSSVLKVLFLNSMIVVYIYFTLYTALSVMICYIIAS